MIYNTNFSIRFQCKVFNFIVVVDWWYTTFLRRFKYIPLDLRIYRYRG